MPPLSNNMHLKKFSQTFCTVACNVSLLLNSFLPYFAAVPAYAEEPTPTPIVESTPAPTPEVTTAPEITITPEPTSVPEVTVAPTETPVEPTAVPTEEPTATPTEEPIVSPEPTAPAETVTPEVTTTPSENNNQSSDNNSSNNSSNSTPNTSSATPTPAFMAPSPTPTPRIVEQVCPVNGDVMRDSVELDWNYDCATDSYVTREKVQLGVKYIFPKENNVTVTFTSLPKDELYRSFLRIKQVKTSDLKLPENMGNVGEYAYDITTDMFDGEFKYDITLPKNSDQTAEISYIEKSLEQAKTGVTANEINSIDESKVEQSDNSVKATSVDHFTIFIVYMFNSAGQSVVNPSEPGSDHKINICHWDNGQGGKWTINNVDDSAVLGSSGHDAHSNDIIPKFDYQLWEKTGSHLVCPNNYTLIGNMCKRPGHSDRTPTSVDDYGWVTHSYLGKNWTVANQAIYINGCKVPTAILTAHNFDDTDGDGILDAGEVSEAYPWNMHLYSGTGCSGQLIASGGTTLPSGNYTFGSLAPGSYSVSEDLMNAAYIFTTASCQNVTLAAGDNKTLNFGNFSYGYILGTKFNDLDGDKIKDAGEPGLANWTIQLQHTNGQVIGTTLTDVNGDYKFSNLTYGTYRVREVNQTGWTQTTNNPNDITVISGSWNANVNFGNKLDTGSIKVIKQSHPEDTQNFIFTLSGVGSTELDDDSGHDASARPNNHTFTKLVPGTYTLSENQVSGWYLDDINCTGISSSAIKKDINNRQVEITLAAGQNPVCTFDNYKSGSIRVCKIIIDGDRHVVNGSETPGSSFTINWNNGLNPTVINAGYTPNTRLLKSTPHDKKDAYCTIINDLKITNYHYSQESINNTSIWQTPKYNDQYDESIHDLSDFYYYDHNVNSNGDINLALNPPGINRTLVLLNQYKLGKINVAKYNDLNGNGIRDCISNTNNGKESKMMSQCQMEPLLPGWTMNLSGNGSKVTGDNGSTTFDSLSPNTYTLSENIKEGWTQTGITCSNDSVPTQTCGDGVVNGDEQCDDGNRVNDDECDNTCHNVESREFDCQDGIDNDGDGHTDYDDRDCFVSFQLVKPVNATNEIVSDSYNHKHVRVNAGDNVNCYVGNQLIVPTAEISKTNDAAGDLSPGNSVGYKIKVKILGNSVSNFKVTDLLSNGFVYRSGSFGVTKNGSPISITEPVYHSPGVWDLGNLNAGDELELTYIADISAAQQPGLYYDLAWAKGQATYGDSGDVIAVSESFADENFVGTEVPVVRSTQNSVSAGVEKQETRSGDVLGASTELPSTGSSTSWLIICTLMSLLGFTLIKKSKKILSVLLFAAFFLFPSNASAVGNLSVRLEKPKTPINTNNVELNFVAMDIDQSNIIVKCFKKYSTDAGFSQFGADISSPNVGYNANHCSLSPVLTAEGSYQFYVEANGVNSNTVVMEYKTSGPGTPNDYRKDHPNNCDYKIHFKTADDAGKTVKVEVYRSDITNFILDAGSVVSTVSVGSNEERDITNSVPDCNKNYYYVIRAFDNAGNGSSPVGDSVVTSTVTTTSTTGTTVTTGTGAIPVVNVTLAPDQDNTNVTGTPSETTGEGSVLGTQEAAKNFLQKYWLHLILLLVIVVRIIGYVLSKKKSSRRR